MNSTNGTFTWTPGETFGPGTYPVTVRVTDADGLSDTETFLIRVRALLRLTVVSFNESGVQLSWPSVPGEKYRVYYTSSFASHQWFSLTEITATGSITTVADPTLPTRQRLYYIQVLP